MSSYYRIILLTLFLSTSSIQASPVYTEDLYIMLALDSEKNNNAKDSFKYYNILYKQVKSQQYLRKAIFYSYKAKKFDDMYELAKNALEEFPKNKEYYSQKMIVALVSQSKTTKALKDAKLLIKKYPNATNYEIMANVYYAKKDYKNSLKYYESAYIINQNEITLIKLTNVLYTYLNKKNVALAYLETYVQTKGCTKRVCDKLMLIYKEQGNVDGMLSILNRIYIQYKKDPSLDKATLIIQNLIVNLLENKDIKSAIKFLEETKIDQAKLINLYYQDGQLKKALQMTRKLYRKTRKPDLLGKIAMYEFELADDKRKVMKHVVANFELALSSGINNASYQNYYGYLLIDYNINVQKGINLIKSALKTSPNNVAYLDSLAWGYYKLGECKKAFNIMKKVIRVTGLEDLEIQHHWNMIQVCKKGKK
jgi:tetratricopeptide (TPR) repeat protein